MLAYWKLLSRNSEGWKEKKGRTGLLLTDPLTQVLNRQYIKPSESQ